VSGLVISPSGATPSFLSARSPVCGTSAGHWHPALALAADSLEGDTIVQGGKQTEFNVLDFES
jgi:hypothetical protein